MATTKKAKPVKKRKRTKASIEKQRRSMRKTMRAKRAQKTRRAPGILDTIIREVVRQELRAILGV